MNEKDLLQRIRKARADRDRRCYRLNRFYDLAVPERVRVGSKLADTIPNADEQDDLFDQELQNAVNDFASDQVDFFCPDYKPWVKMKAATTLSSGEQRQFEEALKGYQDRLYELIRQTDFYEQAFEIFVDVAGSAAGINIPYAKLDRPVRCQPILMAGLLMDEGPYNDLDGRWHEFMAPKDHLREMFPGVDMTAANLMMSRQYGRVPVIQGCHRVWPDEGPPSWMWSLFVNNKLVQQKELLPGEPPQIAIARWRHAPPSAWGPGPSSLAMSAGQTLDELAVLNLKKLGKEADPPFTYENDGVFNPDQGVDPGVYLGRRAGSAPPTPLYEAQTSQNLYFDRETLRMVVKRALYQDGPYQRGDTPPTATQWLDEKALQERRQKARRRIHREFVLPVLQRFAWLFAMRGELPPVEIGGREVVVEFESPTSKASDTEEVSSGMQFASSAVGIFGETALASIDPQATMENWKKKLGDTTVEIVDPDQQANLLQQLLGQGRNLVNNAAPEIR